jgi:chromate transporter
VILNLALFFGYHILWPNDFDGQFEWISAVIAIAAAIALFRYKINVMKVIGVSALAGLIIKMFL